MYSIYADGVCIYNDVFSLDDMKAVNPTPTPRTRSPHWGSRQCRSSTPTRA